MKTFAQDCMQVGKFDQADCLLREVLEQERKGKDSPRRRNATANTLGWLALNLLLQERYDEAEPLAREAVALNQLEEYRRYLWASVLGAVLVGRQKYAEAEPYLLRGYEGQKRLVHLQPSRRRRLTQSGEWIVSLYEATNQLEKARAWREKLQSSAHPK